MKWNDVAYLNGNIFVKIIHAKKGGEASFLIPKKIGDYEVGLDWKEYQMRVPHKDGRIWFTPHRTRDTYTDQYVGKNQIGTYAFEIATYLGRQDADKFTGHTFRRTSATILADEGATVLDLKRHGSWKSDSVAEGYVASSLDAKKNIAAKISGQKCDDEEAHVIIPPVINTNNAPSTIMYFNNCQVTVVQDPNILK